MDDAIVRQALLSAAKGDYRAIPIALKLLDREEAAGGTEAPKEDIFNETIDRLVMDDIVRRIRATSPVEPADGNAGSKPDKGDL